VIAPLAYGIVALTAVAALWGLATAALNRAPGRAQLLFAAGVELVVLVQSVIGFARLAGGFDPAEPATTVGYLIGILVLIPAAWFWANTERTRFSGLVLAVAAFGVLAMTLRLLVLWVPA
jgi:hypothetical protein